MNIRWVKECKGGWIQGCRRKSQESVRVIILDVSADSPLFPRPITGQAIAQRSIGFVVFTFGTYCQHILLFAFLHSSVHQD